MLKKHDEQMTYLMFCEFVFLSLRFSKKKREYCDTTSLSVRL